MIGVLLSTYLFVGAFYYLYAVVKTYELLGFWNFDIKDGHVGLCKYPKYLLCWLEWIVVKLKGMMNK